MLPLTNKAHPAQGDGTCDHTPTERAINIVTSLPYFALGLNTYRRADPRRPAGAIAPDSDFVQDTLYT